MLFNSSQFFVFFTIVFSLYLCLKKKHQNILLLGASYVFYGAWNWKFLSLLWISTIVDYFCALEINKTELQKRKKFFLFISICTNLFILGIFKYCNFFVNSFQALLKPFGLSTSIPYFNIILPIGISFYTFQTLSYTIDVYYRRMQPTKKFLDFALFVAFFPQLVAGPIERAKNLLPQIASKRHLSFPQFFEGCFLIFWGLFQKVYIADNLAQIVDLCFSNPDTMRYGPTVLLALYAFAFQIFCDFAGYSNIARGIGKCLGFNIMINFNLPYFSTNPQEFWKRWHISLSSWLKDYLYIPLGGNRQGQSKTYRNIFITMLLGGLWHGAAWTFILWGAYQGCLIVIYRKIKPFFSSNNKYSEKIWFVLKVVFFFHVTCLGWLIFRAQSVEQILIMLQALIFHWQDITLYKFFDLLNMLNPYVPIIIFVQILQYWKKDLMIIYKLPMFLRATLYYVFSLLLIIYGVTGAKAFIYFQF